MVPRYVSGIKPDICIKHICCSSEGTAAISDNGDLYQWGYGQSEPLQIKIPDVEIQKISMGFGHSLCLTKCGKLYGWGLCEYGQLGSAAQETKAIITPVQLKQFSDYDIRDVECCGLYTVIQTKYKIFVLGYNDSLFNKKRNIQPYQVILTDERVQYFGCSRYDFAVIAHKNT